MSLPKGFFTGFSLWWEAKRSSYEGKSPERSLLDLEDLLHDSHSYGMPSWSVVKIQLNARERKLRTIAFPMPSSRPKRYDFSYQGIYPCPICRFNQLKAMSLMDAMACDYCRHIFTADVERQRIKTADRYPVLTWYWNGKFWKGAHLEGVEWGWVYWLFAVAFIAFPTTIIGLAAYTFPPSPDSNLSWFPIAWTGLTFLLHLGIISWLVMEFYQFPLRMYLRVRRQQLFGR